MGSRRRSQVAGRLALGVLLAGAAFGVAPRAFPFPQATQEAAAEDEAPPQGPPFLHDDFESPHVAWRREHTDATINLLAHERSDRAAHDGATSERFEFEAGPGSQFYVSYPLPNVPVTDALEAVLSVRSNRVGVQVFLRVVLPKDVDPDTRAPSFVMIPGTISDRVDRWQRLEVVDLPPSIERQARVLRAASRRPVSLENAYVDSVLVDLLAGEGGAEVFLDNLSIGPVPEALADSWTPAGIPVATAPAPPSPVPPTDDAATPMRGKYDRIRLDRNRLRRLGDDRRLRDWFPTAIEAPGADITELRRHGFDVFIDDHDADPSRFQEAVERGFTLMPKLSEPTGEENDRDVRLKEVKDFPFKESASFWMIGRDLGANRQMKVRAEELAETRKLIHALHGMPPTFSRLTVGEVKGELPLYARAPSNLDSIAIPTNHWAAAQDQNEFFKYLSQRRDLTAKANSGQLYWAILPATAPADVLRNIWGDSPPPGWGVPTPRPEQLRLATYLALSAGYRGLIFQGNSDLTSYAARAQLIESAVLNMEIDLMESILANSSDPIPVHPVFDPAPSYLPPPGAMITMKVPLQPELKPKPFHKAAAISVDRRGALLLMADYSDYAQYQPHQMATHNLVIQAILPEGVEAFEISPGGIEVLNHKRVPGGTHVEVNEFDVTSMILCTTDLAIKDRLEAAIASARPTAVQLAIEQAELMYQQVVEINGRLAADGISITTEEHIKQRRELGYTKHYEDSTGLLALAEASIKSAREARDREEYALAWKEARRAHRPLRHLAFNHWVEGFKAFVAAVTAGEPDPDPNDPNPPPINYLKPTSCPPLVSFNTLPELYVWLDWISGKTGYQFGPNRIPSGAFDDADEMLDDGWMDMSYQMDRITSKMAVVPPDVNVPDSPRGNLAVRMNATPVNPTELETRLPPFVDHPLVAVRSPALKVQANNLLRISVLVRRPINSVPGGGGIIVRDSIGGERLQFRTTDPIVNWSRVVLYRKVPADGDLSVTFGLAGYGEAWFDDFRVELVEHDRSDAPLLEDDLIVEERPPSRRDAPSSSSTDLEEAGSPRLPAPSLPASTATSEQNRANRR